MPSRSGRTRDRQQRGKGFNRETNLRRGVPIREERRSVLIVTNGENTEVDYFDALKGEPWVTADKITVKFINGSPVKAVVRAAEIRTENAYDEAWAVCDVDQYDVQPAITEAAAHEDVELVLSQPCFEVWLILHLRPGCPGFNDATQAGAHLKKILSHWDKTALRFSDFKVGVFKAVDLAQRLDKPPEANPSTAVWRVIKSLRGDPDLPDGDTQ